MGQMAAVVRAVADVRDADEDAFGRFYEMRRRLAPALQAMVDIEAAMYGLTPRERQVLNLMLDAVGYEVIAKRLGIAMSTVKVLANAVCRKFGVHSAREIAAIVFRRT
jgi:DNA-binding CsgD family transcriptional regulator